METLTKLNHVISHNANLCKLKRIEIIQRMFPNRNEIKPQINDRKISGRPPNTLKLSNTFLNNLSLKRKLHGN